MPAPAEPSGVREALNEAVETIAEVFFDKDFGSLNPNQKKEVSQCVRVIRGGAWQKKKSDTTEDLDPPPTGDEIRRRVAEYRMRWRDGGNLTCRALATQWGQLIPVDNTVHVDVTPTIEALIEAFRLDRPADDRWAGNVAARLIHAGATIDAFGGQVTTPEVQRRMRDFASRFKKDLTFDALAERWGELAEPLPQTSSDTTVSNYETWTPAYAPVENTETCIPNPVATTEPGAFDEAAWFDRQLAEQRRGLALEVFQSTCPAPARGATPKALSSATPAYAPELLQHVAAWVKQPTDFLVLYGPTGTGKTFIACAIGYRFAHDGHITMFIRYSDLMTQIRSEWGRNSDGSSILDRARAADLLILDELGATGNLRDWELPYFDTLINGRLDRGKPTIITTNLRAADSEGLEADLERHVGKRFASRFMLGTVLGVGGPDRRGLRTSP